MKIGIGPITTQIPPSADVTTAEQYRGDVAVVERADDLGFDSAWFGEHHFVDDGHCTDPLSFLAAAATRTSDITLGTGVLLAPLYDPIQVAERAATVDNLAAGRTVLGLGMGYRDAELEGFGVPPEERLARFVETVQICRQAFEDGVVDIDGKVYAYEDLEVYPRPAQDGGPPLWLGATTEKAIRRAGRLGDNWLAGQFFEIPGIRERAGWFRDSAGASELELPLGRHCFVAESEEAAWEAVRDGIEHRERNYFEWDDKEWTDAHLDRIREKGIFGSPDEVAAELRRYDDELDVDLHFMLLFAYPGMRSERVMEGLELFADEVMPQLPD